MIYRDYFWWLYQVLLLKSYLQAKGLKDVYTGGLGSFSLTIMVVFYLEVSICYPLEVNWVLSFHPNEYHVRNLFLAVGGLTYSRFLLSPDMSGAMPNIKCRSKKIYLQSSYPLFFWSGVGTFSYNTFHVW